MQVVPAVALALSLLAGSRPVAAQGPRPEVRYRVHARVDDTTGVVTGTARIHYRHAGTAPLDSLVLRLGDDPSAITSGALRTHATDTTLLGFQEVSAVTADGAAIPLRRDDRTEAAYLHIRLPRPLVAHDSVLLAITWRTRPPATGNRVERRGRDLQLTGWYPLVLDVTAGTAVLTPAFGTHRVALDVAADQVIGGTGVPTCGDPGWRRALARTENDIDLRPDYYSRPRDPAAAACDRDEAPPGRRRLTWYAEGVSELVLALSPDFRYEEGDIFFRPVRALYRRGNERVWGAGLTTRRMETALAWTDEILQLGQRFPWPQTTVIEALPGSAAAHPMVLFAESSNQSALLSLLALMITEQVVAGGDRDFTRGTAAFHTAWFFETLGRRGDYARVERQILEWDLDRRAGGEEPLRGPDPPSACRTTTCRRAEFTFHQLRRWADQDSLVRRLYGRTVREYLLQPTPAGTFARISAELIRPRPDSLYMQLRNGRTLYDDALADVRREPVGDGWLTSLTVERRAAGLFPQTVWVIGESDTVAARATALLPSETLVVATRSRPLRVVLDPLAESHDWNMLNNQRGFTTPVPWHPWRWLPLRSHAPVDNYVDLYFSRRRSRTRLTRGWAPAAWYNDTGGWTFGVRTREDYLGRFELNETWLAVSEHTGRQRVHGSLRLQNPTWLFAPRWSQSLELIALEGRAAAQLDVGYRFPTPVGDSIVRTARAGLHWLTVMDEIWLHPSQYQDAATAELAVGFREMRVNEESRRSVEGALLAGYAWPGASMASPAGSYARLTLTGSARRDLSPRITVGARVFAGAAVTEHALPRQRLLFWSHPDPWEQLRQPLLRSLGAALTRPGFHYHDPGGVGVRGIAADFASRRALALSLETEYVLVRRPDNPLLRRAALAGFVDAGMGDEDAAGDGSWGVLADAGVGIRFEHRVGRTRFSTRLDLPLWVNRPELAQDDRDHRALAPRWTFSLAPSF